MGRLGRAARMRRGRVVTMREFLFTGKTGGEVRTGLTLIREREDGVG